MQLKTIVSFFISKPSKKKPYISKSFTYRKLLKKLSEMSDDELDCQIFVYKSQVMHKVNNLLICKKDLDILSTGEFYLDIE